MCATSLNYSIAFFREPSPLSITLSQQMQNRFSVFLILATCLTVSPIHLLSQRKHYGCIRLWEKFSVFTNGRVMYLGEVVHVQTLYKAKLPHRQWHQSTAAYNFPCGLVFLLPAGTFSTRNTSSSFVLLFRFAGKKGRELLHAVRNIVIVNYICGTKRILNSTFAEWFERDSFLSFIHFHFNRLELMVIDTGKKNKIQTQE